MIGPPDVTSILLHSMSQSNKRSLLLNEQYEPVIRLEVLTQRQTQVLFILTYIILALSVFINGMESMWHSEATTIPWSTYQVNDSAFIEMDFNLSKLEMYYSICFTEMWRFLPYEDDVIALANFSGGDNLLVPSYYPILYEVLIETYSTNSTVILHDSTQIYDMRCAGSIGNSTRQVCAANCIVQPGMYDINYEKHGMGSTNFRVTMELKNILLEDGNFKLPISQEYGVNVTTAFNGELSLGIQSEGYQVFEIVLHAIFSVATLVCLALYSRAMQIVERSRRTDSVAEQKWIVWLLLGVFLFQGPLFIPSILLQKDVYRVISDVGYNVGIVAILILALLIVDSIAATLKAVLAEMTVDTFIVAGNYGILNSFPWSFYTPKIILGVIMAASYSIYSILPPSSVLEGHATENWQYHVWLASGAMQLISTIWWFLWLVLSTRYASNCLQKLPYLSTRFRQLSFQFFIMQTTLVLSFITMQYLTSGILMFHQKNLSLAFNARSTSMGTFILISFYSYTLAFIYSPVRSNSLKRVKSSSLFDFVESNTDTIVDVFSFNSARVLLEFSWNAYYENPLENSISSMDGEEIEIDVEDKVGIEVTTEKFDVSEYDFKMVNEIEDETTKTSCYVVRRGRNVIVAFRGTMGLENAKTNLWTSRAAVMYSSNSEDDDLLANYMYGAVHSGFLNAYKSVRRDVQAALDTIIHDYRHFEAPLKVFITGHSLGGALATLCAFELCSRYRDLDVRMYSFGSPRVGDHAFSRKYNKLVPKSFRFVCDRDFITTIPKFLWLYKHVGIEILIDTHGNHLFEPSFIDKNFRFSRSSWEDHSLVSYLKGLSILCRFEGSLNQELV